MLPAAHPHVVQVMAQRDRYPYIVTLSVDDPASPADFHAEYPLADFVRHEIGDRCVVWMFRLLIDKKEFEQWLTAQM